MKSSKTRRKNTKRKEPHKSQGKKCNSKLNMKSIEKKMNKHLSFSRNKEISLTPRCRQVKALSKKYKEIVTRQLLARSSKRDTFNNSEKMNRTFGRTTKQNPKLTVFKDNQKNDRA